ncbi:MAG TPA: hypothetical protein ENN05_04340 [Deltaproteobacteria bacterium]|nr:hypothetical protein [Deltaproteobacteria bacterium]
MKTSALVFLISFLWAGIICAEEYAIIKESLFGTQKIEFYKTQEDALRNYKGEGTLYRITRSKIAVKQVETKKRIEVTEYEWIVDKNNDINTKQKAR